MASKLKLLKEEEKLLLSIEKKLTNHLQELKKEEVYLQAVLSQTEVQAQKDDDEENTAIKEMVSLDDETINEAPLDDLNQASSSFYQMYKGENAELGEEEEEEEDAGYADGDFSHNLVNIIRQMQGND